MNKAASRFVLPAAVGASLLAAVASAQQPQPREPDEEYGEWLARPTELATVPVDRIPRSLRLNGQAMLLGQKVYTSTVPDVTAPTSRACPTSIPRI